jgi:hypothetical protein
MKRKKPSFNESYHGYRTFSDLLEDAEKEGIIQLRSDPRSGTYVITGFGKEGKKPEGEEKKERITQKPQKPRWRPRPRRPKAQASALAPEFTADSSAEPPVEPTAGPAAGPAAPNPSETEPAA